MMDTIKKVMGFARVHTNGSFYNHEDRRDALQECMVKYVKMLNDPKMTESKFLRSAKAVTRNTVRDFIRNKVQRSSAKTHECMTERSVRIDLELVSLECAAKDFMLGLNDEGKIILEALFHGYAIKQIAELSGISKHKIRKISNNLKEIAKNAVHIQ